MYVDFGAVAGATMLYLFFVAIGAIFTALIYQMVVSASLKYSDVRFLHKNNKLVIFGVVGLGFAATMKLSTYGLAINALLLIVICGLTVGAIAITYGAGLRLVPSGVTPPEE